MLSEHLADISKRLDEHMIPTCRDRLYHRITRDFMSTIDAQNTCESTIEFVKLAKQRMKIYFDMTQENVDSIREYMLFLYCRQVWIAEQNVPDSDLTSQSVMLAIQTNNEKVSNELIDSARLLVRPNTNEIDQVAKKIGTKINNIVTVSQSLFGTKSQRDHRITPNEPMTTEFSHKIHKQLMTGLLTTSECGAFRTISVGPTGSGRIYTQPELLPSRLETLMNFVQTKREEIIRSGISPFERFYSLLGLGGLFIIEFLSIHPYRNGNGRTMRILFSTLISKAHNRIPISLFEVREISPDRKIQREHYIHALESSRGNQPLAIVRWVLDCTRNYLFELHDII